jgi:hypothetical protein
MLWWFSGVSVSFGDFREIPCVVVVFVSFGEFWCFCGTAKTTQKKKEPPAGLRESLS